ncbi:MAG TPA: VOC family protein [Mycobacterium sp.]|nr:VOC family protein [Mycobacterium sp.]
MQRIVPNVWCQGTAAEAAGFYASVFPDATRTVTARYPETDLPDFQRDYAGKELVVDVTIREYRVRLINAGNEFAPTPALSFIVSINPDHFGGAQGAHSEIDRIWQPLADGGEIRLPLQSYPHSPYYGWVADRFGVNWQLMLVAQDGQERPGIIPQFLFTGAEPRAREAIDVYTGLFGDPPPALLLPYPGREQPEDAVMFAGFTLAGQWFSAMDGGTDHDFTFTPGVSLEVDCADQTEIDRLWDALSAVPEAEQCGWLVDRFGVSWQIVPTMLNELMERPGAYHQMLGMKKLVIADF